jgi:peptidoglycan/xylan/chitin deacetylase (PgdA/CDA1 family)
MELLGLLAICIAVASSPPVSAGPVSPVGETRIAKWKDNRKAVFLLMFDDGWPSHWQVAVPELARRGMVGTFYIVPRKAEYRKFEKEWRKAVEQGMTIASHTATHDGFQGAEDAEMEVGEGTRYILDFVKGKNPRLISFGLPGVKDYNFGEGGSLQALLTKNHLIDRGEFKDHGAVYHLKTTAEMLALADKAIASGGLEYLVIHGVERIDPDWGFQDMWPLKQEIFLPLLDALKVRKDRGDLWITDHISAHQYETERQSAAVRVVGVEPGAIRLECFSSADPQFYDQPLTLRTAVPPSWQRCRIEQGTQQREATADGGVVQYEALPNGGVITLKPLPGAPIAAQSPPAR